MQCEMCGKERELFKISIENSEMEVCKICSEHGEVIKEKVFRGSVSKDKVVRVVKGDYSKILKNSREKMNLKQEEVARKMNIKESVLHKVESGMHEPDIDLAEKFERFFNVELLEEYNEAKEFNSSSESKNLTIGDLLKEKS